MNGFAAGGLLFASAFLAGTLQAKVVDVAPSGGNDTPHVTAAVAALKDGDTLRFAKGTYHFHPDGAMRRRLLPCGSTGGERSVAMCFEDLSDIVIDGGGASFVWHGDISPFAFLRCRRIEAGNFSSTLNRTSVIELVVETKDDEGFVLSATGRDVCLRDGALVFKTDLGEFSSALDGRISLHAISRMLIGYLFVGDAPGPRTGLPSWHMNADAEALGDGRYRFRYRSGDPAAVKCPYETGELLGVNTEMKRERCTVLCEDCSDVTFRDVTMRRGGGMGIVAQQCENMTLERFRVIPEPGERVSLTADCIFLVNCRGRVQVTDCDIGHAFDDAMNCHGNYTRVGKAEGGRVRVSLCHPRHRFAMPFRRGDRVEFIDSQTLAVVCSRDVAEVGAVSEDGMSVDLGFSEPLPVLSPGTLVEDVSAHPDVTIRGCRFHDTMHLRLSGRGKYLVESNRFERGSGLIVIDLFKYWGEAGRISDMVVRNNVFRDFNSMSGSAFISAGVSGFGENAPLVHRGLVITNNVYSGLVDKFTRLRGTDGAVVRDNREISGDDRSISAQ